IEGTGAIAMGSRVGLAANLHTAGVAKVILAFSDEPTRRRLERGITFERFTPNTIVAPAKLEEDLSVSRSRGWAEDDGEKEEYINCVALPIFDANGHLCAGMSVTSLRAVMPLEQLRRHVPDFKDVAQRISKELGWNGEQIT
ncbi:MAG: IclR family transcriptional regulator, partial [Actinobacteria bacterium]|nr:IclR family transcriptional regulator [Actinomycetota bacterium]